MKIRVTVTIADQDYTLVGSEDVEYVEKVAAYVDDKLREVTQGGRFSLVNGAVLTAVNIADEYFKELEAAENLRRQLKEYLDEATKTKLELSEAKRRIFQLENEKHAPGGKSAQK
ncbi:MAG: cell division protein ZapA [Oscillospiraceae bacterium]|nr:cell division protein ZapA [Oscillospiraceae bacterium]